MSEVLKGINNASELLCQALLTEKRTSPSDTRFRDDLFVKNYQDFEESNETTVVAHLTPLIAPNVQSLKIYGAIEPSNLASTINERWPESIPVTKSLPQSDYCMRFDQSAFAANRMQKMLFYMNNLIPVEYSSIFTATWRKFFPFFACEAKSGCGSLDVVNRRNTHSMTMAVQGIVEFFKQVHRWSELHRKTLAFSISHDATTVGIFRHHALIQHRRATLYRHLIPAFDFTSQNGQEKWTAYLFTLIVYFDFMPKLHKPICSAPDDLSLNLALAVDLARMLSMPSSDSLGSDFESESEPAPALAPLDASGKARNVFTSVKTTASKGTTLTRGRG